MIELTISLLMLFGGHIFRTMRWRHILQLNGIKVTNLKPLTALSIGYVFNTLLPFRVGDILRSLLLSIWARERFSTIISSIILEKIFDIAFILIFLSIADFFNLFVFDEFYFLFFLVPIVFLFFLNRTFKTFIYFISSFFNKKIKIEILNAFIVLVFNIKNYRFYYSFDFLIYSSLMWFFYLSSLYFFTESLSFNFFDSFIFIYFDYLSMGFFERIKSNNIYIFYYLIIPVAFEILIVFFVRFDIFIFLRRKVSCFLQIGYADAMRLKKIDFISIDQYYDYTEKLFMGGKELISEFYRHALTDGVVHRVFHGGSGAVTALVETEGKLLVRKFACCDLSHKLAVQKDWIKFFSKDLPLVQIVEEKKNKNYFFYDMDYESSTVDFYDFIHSNKFETNIEVFSDILNTIKTFHSKNRIEDAGKEVLEKYYLEKVEKNYKIIKEVYSEFFVYEYISVNGVLIETKKVDDFFESCNFLLNFRHKQQSHVHGDLTIENILIKRGVGYSWFLIDPNPDNGFSSPLIDYSKIMQSLHLGYELINKNPKCSIDNYIINISLEKSEKYHNLYLHYRKSLLHEYGGDYLREVMLHEIVNYLRLIPYQARKSREAGASFLGCLFILISEYVKEYEVVEK